MTTSVGRLRTIPSTAAHAAYKSEGRSALPAGASAQFFKKAARSTA
jgi:hypothetical protein